MTKDLRSNPDFVSLGSVTGDEIRAVCGALLIVRHNDNSLSGPLLRSENGHRRWQIANDDIIINVEGGSCDFEGTFWLQKQFMMNCQILVDLRSQAVMTICDGKISAISPAGTLTMLCGPGNTDFRVIRQLQTVTGRISLRSLYRTLETCIPGPSSNKERGLMDPENSCTTSIQFINNTMICKTTWHQWGYQNVLVSTPAITTGSGEVSVSSTLLHRMISSMLPLSDHEVDVSFDPLGGDFIEFSGPMTYIALRRTLIGADAAFDKIRRLLKERFIKHIVSDNGTLAADVDGVPIRVTILEGEREKPAIARCTSVVANNVGESPLLMRELNVFNKTLTNSRVWFDNNTVVIGRDIYLSELDSFITHFDSLVKDARTFPGVLGPLGVEPDDATT